MKIERFICKYDNESEELVEERIINDIGLDMLRNIFHPPDDDLNMYNAYEVKEPEKEKLKKLVDINFNFEKYSYYLECFQRE